MMQEFSVEAVTTTLGSVFSGVETKFYYRAKPENSGLKSMKIIEKTFENCKIFSENFYVFADCGGK